MLTISISHTHDNHNESDSETPSGDVKAVMRTARKSMGRAMDSVKAGFDAANIPLPDTPLALVSALSLTKESLSDIHAGTRSPRSPLK